MKFIRFLIFAFTIALVLGGAAAYWLYSSLHAPQTHALADEYIKIERGSTPSAIVDQLTGKGVLASELPLSIYMKLSDAETRLKAGEYRFPSPITPLEVLSKLRQGQQRLNRFTVIEGWTRWDIAEAMHRVPELKLRNTDEALKLMDDVSLIRDIDSAATNLEGYLYPDTYSFPPDTTPNEMIRAMVKRFRQEWDRDFADQARRTNKTPREIVTIASLIETEAKLPSERKLVASVINNRLQRNINLGIDSSVIYASKLAGKWRDDGKVYQSDLDRESPYNTRKVAGLPPGPVASPGQSSLQAALAPAETDYLYYVRDPARDDGAHNFYASETEFWRGVEALRDWERARDARN